MTGWRVSRRGHGASILVAALSTGFGVVLLLATGILSTYISHTSLGESGPVQIILLIVAAVFIVIAVYVGAIVTTNTFATIVAGRVRSLALLRLVGASARSLRRSVAREGLFVGVAGAAAGVAAGELVILVGIRVLVGTGLLPDLDYALIGPVVIVSPVIVILTTWWASWLGSRRVLAVTPLQAIAGSVEKTHEETVRRAGRNSVAIAMFALGVLLLVAGIVVGSVSPLAIFVAVIGGILSFTGLVIGADLIMPPVLRIIGALLGGSAPAKLASANTLRYPERSSRTAIGLVIGVTLVTMFSVAAQTYQAVLLSAEANSPEAYAGMGMDPVLVATVAVFSVLVGFSAVIAAVGMVNSLSLSVLQRSRELGLLRALGFTASQVRALVLAESVQIAVASVATGLVLGIFYGWAGAQSLLGSMPGGGLIAPAVPWPILVIAAVVCAVLAAVASIAPTQRAVKTSPMAALTVE